MRYESGEGGGSWGAGYGEEGRNTPGLGHALRSYFSGDLGDSGVWGSPWEVFFWCFYHVSVTWWLSEVHGHCEWGREYEGLGKKLGADWGQAGYQEELFWPPEASCSLEQNRNMGQGGPGRGGWGEAESLSLSLLGEAGRGQSGPERCCVYVPKCFCFKNFLKKLWSTHTLMPSPVLH